LSIKKTVVKKRVRPIEVQGNKPHLTKTISVYYPKRGHTDLPEGTLVKDIVYYGSRGPRQLEHSINNGQNWSKGFSWSDLPLSQGTEVRRV